MVVHPLHSEFTKDSWAVAVLEGDNLANFIA